MRPEQWSQASAAPARSADPKLLARHGLTVDDIDLWELNEAFASQAIYCQQTLGISDERLNVNGGAVSIGHPFGTTGARLVGHVLRRVFGGLREGGPDARRRLEGARAALWNIFKMEPSCPT